MSELNVSEYILGNYYIEKLKTNVDIIQRMKTNNISALNNISDILHSFSHSSLIMDKLDSLRKNMKSYVPIFEDAPGIRPNFIEQLKNVVVEHPYLATDSVFLESLGIDEISKINDIFSAPSSLIILFGGKILSGSIEKIMNDYPLNEVELACNFASIYHNSITLKIKEVLIDNSNLSSLLISKYPEWEIDVNNYNELTNEYLLEMYLTDQGKINWNSSLINLNDSTLENVQIAFKTICIILNDIVSNLSIKYSPSINLLIRNIQMERFI